MFHSIQQSTGVGYSTTCIRLEYLLVLLLWEAFVEVERESWSAAIYPMCVLAIFSFQVGWNGLICLVSWTETFPDYFS